MASSQNAQLLSSLKNYIMSSEMEGLSVSDTVQAMCLSVLNGETSLDDCISQLNRKYAEA
ncbi:MAG: hypothetical protein ACI4PD_08060 [Butyricicoccus sp.]